MLFIIHETMTGFLQRDKWGSWIIFMALCMIIFFWYCKIPFPFASLTWTLSTTLRYLRELWLPHVAFHLHTCSQQPDLVFPLWSFRQSVHSRILHLSHATKLLYQRWWVPVFIQCSHLGAVMDYWDGCMLLNVVIKLAKKSMLKHDGNEDV